MIFSNSSKQNFRSALALFRRELMISKQKSFFNFFWDVLEPLILAIFFIILYKKKVFSVPNTGMSFGLYVAFGMLLWQSFLEALNQPVAIFDKYKNLFAHVKINNIVILITLVFSLVYSLSFRVAIMVIILIYYQNFTLTYALSFILVSIIIIIPGISLGIFLAAFGTFREDIKRLIALISRPLMFLSCTIFPMPNVGIMSYIDYLNPAAVFINNLRYIAVNGTFYNGTALALWIIFFLLFFIFAWKLFNFAVKYIVDRA